MADEQQLAILRQGVEEWNRWREDNPEESVDLRGAELNGARLSRANLNWANLFGAKLSDAKLSGANLRGANLRGANLQLTILFSADLFGADLTFANLTQASLCYADISGANLSGADLSGANVNGLIYDRESMPGRYYGIRVDDCYGDTIFKHDAQDQDYIDTVGTRCTNWYGKMKLAVWGWTDYGRSIFRVGLSALILVMVFGTIYKLFPHLVDYGKHHITPFTPYYFSFVTYTTLGFGDVTAGCLAGEILVALEVVLGYLTLGLLLAILANTVARRS